MFGGGILLQHLFILQNKKNYCNNVGKIVVGGGEAENQQQQRPARDLWELSLRELSKSLIVGGGLPSLSGGGGGEGIINPLGSRVRGTERDDATLLRSIAGQFSYATLAARVCVRPSGSGGGGIGSGDEESHVPPVIMGGGRDGEEGLGDSLPLNAQASTREALSFLSRAYGVGRAGGHALLAGASRARLRAYPTTIGEDITALINDLAATAALGLDDIDDAGVSAIALISAISRTSSLSSTSSSSSSYFHDKSEVPTSFSIAFTTFSNVNTTNQTAKNLALEALMAPRQRAARMLLLHEKLLFYGIAKEQERERERN